MKKAVIVIVWAMLSVVSSMAAQVCPGGIPKTTPTADFTVHGDGTVTHKPTGLMWKQCVEGLSGVGCSNGAVNNHTWQQALQLADGHSFAGYRDWRLPNIRELASIVERSCANPAINLRVFPNQPGSAVWSGSPAADASRTRSEKNAWFYVFDFGYENYYVYPDRSVGKQVQLVRGGQ